MTDLTARNRLMLRITALFVVLFVISGTFGIAMPQVLQTFAASPPNTVSYQGRVLNANGVPVADATVDMKFELYDALSGGNCVWSNSSSNCDGNTPASTTARAVTLTDGLFTENLGDTAASPAYASMSDSLFDVSAIYLQVYIEGEALTPRKQISSVPFATNADMLDGFTSDDLLQANGDTASGIWDFTTAFLGGASPLIFEGGTADDFETTFTFTDPTADRTITFQDGTGTVAFLSDISGGGSLFTDSGTVTYLTSTTDDFAIGGAFVNVASFGVDESANTIYLGTGSGANVDTIWRASDGDEGQITYTTDDQWTFSGGHVQVDTLGATDFTCTDCLDFTDLADLLTLDASTNFTLGSNSLSFDATSTGDILVDLMSTGEFRIEDSAVAATLLQVDVNGRVAITPQNHSGTPGTSGSAFAAGGSFTFTDSATAASGTAAAYTVNGFSGGTIAATNSNVTVTDAATLYINNAPTAGTNVTIEASHGLWVANGASSRFDGTLFVSQGGGAAGGVSVTGDSGATGNSLDINHDGNGTAINIDAEATTANAVVIDASAITTGDALQIISGNATDDSGYALFIDSSETTETADLVLIQSDYSSSNNNVFRIEADGEVFSDVGFRAGAFSTGFYDGEIETTSNLLLDIDGGNLTFDQNTIIGDGSDQLTLNSNGALIIDDAGINGTGALEISSGGSQDLTLNSSSGSVKVTSGDDFIVGGSSLVAAFSVDESNNLVRIGDASGTNGELIMYSSAGQSGSIEYGPGGGDYFNFAGGGMYISNFKSFTDHTGLSSNVVLETAVNPGGSIGADRNDYAGHFSLTSSVDKSGNAYNAHALTGYGKFASNTLGGPDMLSGVYGQATFSSNSQTSPDVAGVRGSVLTDIAGGTISSAAGVMGYIESGAGTITSGLGGLFINTNNGTSRYGVLGAASGGTNNYAGYFYGSAVHVESGSTPSTPATATGAGDLFVDDQFEVNGSSVTTGTAAEITPTGLTSGIGLAVSRPTGGSNFTNTLSGLVSFNITQTSASGNLLNLNQDGTGLALDIDQAGNGTAVSVIADDTDDFIAEFLNQGGDDTNLGIAIQACDNDSTITASCDWVEFRDGTGSSVAAIEGTGGSSLTYATTDSDYAELFPGDRTTTGQGDIFMLNDAGEAVLATDPAKIMGAYSIEPSVLGNWRDGWESIDEMVPVGLLGQIPVNVNLEGGAIQAGDYLALSSEPGVAKKATGMGMILGQALESVNEEGQVLAFVQPKWHVVDQLEDDGGVAVVNTGLRMASQGQATAGLTGVASEHFTLRGSAWDGASAVNADMVMYTDVTDDDDYRLRFENGEGTQVAFISNAGDVALAGHLYPSDRGTIQTEKYIFYDGSDGLGGDFMRTNAAGWATGSYDFAEMFPAIDAIAPGEVVIFAADGELVKRSETTTYDTRIAGVISTRPGFLAGDNREGDVPVALAGRVPTYVSLENGSIQAGDPLTTSTKPGYAMKATEPGPIVGYALEDISGVEAGSITVFIRPSYYDARQDTEDFLTLSGLQSSSTLDLSGTINMNMGSITNLHSLRGMTGTWELEADGDFRTRGRFTHVIEAHQGHEVETYATTSTETTVQLTGTARMVDGRAVVMFNDIDGDFNNIISTTAPYRVFLTANAATGQLFVTNRDVEGFTIVESGDLMTNAIIDWMVIAYHKDFEPELFDPMEPVIVDVDSSDDAPASEVASVEEVTTEDPAVEIVEEAQDEGSVDADVASADDASSEDSSDTPEEEATAAVTVEIIQGDTAYESVDSEESGATKESPSDDSSTEHSAENTDPVLE